MKIILGFLLIYVLTGCGRQVDEGVVYDPIGKNRGTVDGGGGNGLHGTPLEYFIVDPKSLLREAPLVETVLFNLEKADVALAGDFLHIIRNRIWYMVPTEVEKISSAQLGVSFPTEQYAIQTDREIFFNSAFVEPMAPDKKAILFLHELIMGVRIMEWQNSYDRCIAVATQELLPTSQSHNYDDKRQKCFNDYGRGSAWGGIINLGSRLEPKDYENVRWLTHYLVTNRDTLDGKEIEDWIALTKFRIRN